MKNFIKQFAFLLLIAFSLVFISCEKQDIEMELEPDTTINNKEIPVTSSVTYGYQYEYKGTIYSEQEWEKRSKTIDNPDLSIIGLNNMLYVFDDPDQAETFKNSELEVKMDALKLELERTKNDPSGRNTVLASTTVIFRLSFYDLQDFKIFKNGIYHATTQLYFVRTVRRMQGTWGAYLDNNVIEENLPVSLRGKVSSWKAEFIQGGSVHSVNNVAQYLVMNIDLYGALIGEENPYNLTNELHNEPGYNSSQYTDYQDGDLTNNALIVGFSWILNWNDFIHSYKIKFGSF